MFQRPCVCTFGSLCSLLREGGVKGSIDPCRHRHRRREIKGSSGRFHYYITGFAALVRCNEALKIRFGQFMIHTSVRILHGEHPSEVIHSFREHIREIGDGRFGYIQTEGVEIGFVEFVCHEPDTHRITGIDDVFVIITCIVPTAGGRDDGSCGTFVRRCRCMDQHMIIGMTGRTRKTFGIGFFGCHGSPLMVVGTKRLPC